MCVSTCLCAVPLEDIVINPLELEQHVVGNHCGYWESKLGLQNSNTCSHLLSHRSSLTWKELKEPFTHLEDDQSMIKKSLELPHATVSCITA